MANRKIREEVIDEEFRKQIGANIKTVRKGNNMTLREFAKVLNISYQYLSAIENGKRLPTLVTLIEIAKETGCSLDYLVFSSTIQVSLEPVIKNLNHALLFLKSLEKRE